MSMIAFSRVIGPVPISCIVSEKHRSRIEVTELPVENGSRITDHAFLLPKEVTLEVADNFAAATHAALVRFQESRVPFTLVTGLKVYKNMLITEISPERDSKFSRVLRCTVDLKEVIIVSTSYAASPDGKDSSQASGKPGGEKSSKAASPDPSRASGNATQDRATSTVQQGDKATVTERDQSLLSKWTGIGAK